MKTAFKQARHGDVFFFKVDKLPNGAKKKALADGKVVLAGSAVGAGQHILSGEGVEFFTTDNPAISAFTLGSVPAKVEHSRKDNEHLPFLLGGEPGTVWEVHRQRETTPDGDRMVED